MNFPTLRLLPLMLAAAPLLPPAVPHAAAQNNGPIIAQPFAIGANRSQRKPYNFTGRILDNNLLTFGSGTLIRRHTVLTAAHVLFEPDTGFATAITFERGLYIDRQTNANRRISNQRVTSLAVLSGYQDVAIPGDEGYSSATGVRDLGYVILSATPVDEDFAPFARQANPQVKDNNLTNETGRFVLGYPGRTFNGSTMAYVVPTEPYVEVAAGFYSNFNYRVEGGMSGGPVYAVIDGVQTVVAETTDGIDGTGGDGTFTLSGVRAIDKEAEAFLISGEYTAGLIAGTTITPADGSITVNPTLNQITVNRGATITVNTAVVFTTPDRLTGAAATTTRYKELRLTSDLSGTPPPFTPTGQPPEPLITIAKVAPNQFRVTFGSNNRPNTLVTLQVMNSKTTNAPSAPIPAGRTTSPAPSQLRVLLR